MDIEEEPPSARQQGTWIGTRLTEGLHAAVSESNSCAVSAALGSLYAPTAQLSIDQVVASGFTDIALALTDACLLGAVFSDISISVQYVPSSITASVTGTLKKMHLPNSNFRFMQSINFLGVLNNWTIARETLLIVHIPTFSLAKTPSLSDSEKKEPSEEENVKSEEGKNEDAIMDERKDSYWEELCSENW